MNAKTLNALPKAKIRFIEPMYARLVQELPEGKEWFYEVKFDGYRCLAGRDSTGVTLWSRRGNLFTKQFLEIAGACGGARRHGTDRLLAALEAANGVLMFRLSASVLYLVVRVMMDRAWRQLAERAGSAWLGRCDQRIAAGVVTDFGQTLFTLTQKSDTWN